MKNIVVIFTLSLFILNSYSINASGILHRYVAVQFAYLHQAQQMNLEKIQSDNGAMTNGIDDILLQANQQEELEIHTSTGRDHAVVVMLTMEIFISLLIFIRLGFDYLKKH